MVDGARSLVAELAAGAFETERLGRLRDDAVAQLLDIGVARMVVPKRWQGLELGFATVLDTVRTLARGCMSSAWVAGLYAEHPWLLAHFDERAQADVWSAGPDVPLSVALAPLGKVQRVSDGFELTGTWPFVSGCDHADWFILTSRFDAAEASSGATALVLVPRDAIAIDQGSWHVAGLRGTGSKTVSVDRAFVPEHRVLDMAGLDGGPTSPELLDVAMFRQPIAGTLLLVLPAVAVGGAEAAIDEFRERMRSRVLRKQGRLQAADPAAQMDLADATEHAKTAWLLLADACERGRRIAERDPAPTALELAEFQLDKPHVVRLCVTAVDRLFAASGGGALQDENPLQRIWRDVHAVQAHVGMTWSTHAENFGSVAVGLEPTLKRIA